MIIYIDEERFIICRNPHFPERSTDKFYVRNPDVDDEQKNTVLNRFTSTWNEYFQDNSVDDSIPGIADLIIYLHRELSVEWRTTSIGDLRKWVRSVEMTD